MDHPLPQMRPEFENYRLHKDIYTWLENQNGKAVDLDAACPPLAVITYATRNIIFLDPPNLDLLPSLLRLVVHLEIVRLDTTNRILDILRLCQLKAPSTSTRHPILREERHAALEKLTKPSRVAVHRKVYREIIHGCCLLHIHHLWRTHRSDTESTVISYAVDYFPAFFKDDPDYRDACARALRVRPWHYGVTDVELADNRRVGKQAATFMLNASSFAQDPEEYCVAHGYDPSSTFEDLFPACDFHSIADAIERFIGMVHQERNALQSVLDMVV
ncbi:hypothetical protein C8Q77DRAFT_1144916 [Trametes polyzona]|nr:hypothetical protein C8Q77DRAFT_1144916 [Trametes polyzona]